MEKLIFLVAIIIISALHSWWKQRQGRLEEDEDQPVPGRPPRRPPPGGAPRPAASPKAANWEEELRRLLEGEAASGRPSPPPPVVVARPMPVAPPPLPTKPRPQPAAPLPYLARTQFPVPDEGQEEETGLPVKMPSLAESAQAFLRGRTLDARVSERFQQVDQIVTTHPKAPARPPAILAIERSRTLLRDRESLRAAIIASVILGPPKALEQAS